MRTCFTDVSLHPFVIVFDLDYFCSKCCSLLRFRRAVEQLGSNGSSGVESERKLTFAIKKRRVDAATDVGARFSEHLKQAASSSPLAGFKGEGIESPCGICLVEAHQDVNLYVINVPPVRGE